MGNFYYLGHVKGKQPTLDEDFYIKVLPTMFIGTLLWLLSTMYFSGLLGDPFITISELSGTQLIILIVLYIVVWVTMFIFTFIRWNTIAMLLFFVGAFLNGLTQSLFISSVAAQIGEELTLYLFSTSSLLAVGATGGGMLIGLMLKDKISKHYCLYFLVFGIVFAIIESVMSLLFGPGNILIDFIVMAYLFGVIIFDSATLPGKIKRGYWMMAVIDIFLDYVLMVIRIFFILLRLANKVK